MTLEDFAEIAKPHPEKRAPILVKCRACEHVWPILWVPCRMELIGKVTPKICPWCGSAKKADHVMASRQAGDLDRYMAQVSRELIRAVHDAVEPAPAT